MMTTNAPCQVGDHVKAQHSDPQYFTCLLVGAPITAITGDTPRPARSSGG